MNFIMWFGNTTILLMAGIMGIEQSLFESAQIDGARPLQVFFRVTLPLLTPILVYVLITAMIGGIQMFDVPQVLTNRLGTPDRTSMTLIMYLNRHLTSNNYGLAGAVSVLVFIVTAILSVFVYKSLMKNYKLPNRKTQKAKNKKATDERAQNGEVLV
jgi:multiple sugar transport system permease protein